MTNTEAQREEETWPRSPNPLGNSVDEGGAILHGASCSSSILQSQQLRRESEGAATVGGSDIAHRSSGRLDKHLAWQRGASLAPSSNILNDVGSWASGTDRGRALCLGWETEAQVSAAERFWHAPGLPPRTLWDLLPHTPFQPPVRPPGPSAALSQPRSGQPGKGIPKAPPPVQLHLGLTVPWDPACAGAQPYPE